MLRILAIVVVIIAAAGYFFFQQDAQSPSQTDTADQLSDETREQAKAHINRLTQGADQAISIQQADNFVTADQLISLPENRSETQRGLIADTPDGSSSAAQGSTFAVNPQLNIIGSQRNAQGGKLSTDTLLLANQIKLQELLDNPEQAGQQIYFIHAVNNNDDKGLWGIIQHGLMRTFTEGLSLPGMDKTVYVEIPEEADERLDDKRSSFLGRVLKNKVDQTYIYNYDKGILGDNPDLIKPGQQLVIVTFSEQELIGIYNHFVNL
ncbi:hypothetical protein [Neptuniibacter halophilus]|uniref:hypothetical protein n=1 Tax=Neptuniibacter halophilus TaxID=651666 RepID=UPI0025725B2B|nr:hypothetical protein [Neptuniibacter halophilus]